MSGEIDPHELILSVQTRNLLYDRNDKLYGNRNFTNNAWKEIAEEIGTDEISARRKWTALRDYFTRQYRAVQAGAGPTKKVRWCFYNNLLFLRDYLDAKPALSSSSVKLDYDPACAEDMESASIVNASHFKSSMSSDEDSVPFDALEEEQHPQRSAQRIRDSRRPRQKRTYANSNVSENNFTNNNIDDDDGGSGGMQISNSSCLESPSHVEEDHDELFLKSLLPDLKCVTDEISKLECKIEIQGVILKFIRQSRSINSAQSNNNNQTDSSSDAT